MNSFEGVFREYDLTGRNAPDAGSLIAEDFKEVDVAGKLVVIRVFGELAGGRASEVGLAGLRSGLLERGAIHVYLNRNAVKSKEATGRVFSGEEPSSIERKLFESEAGKVDVQEEHLRGQRGAELGIELLRLWRQPPKLGETKKDYTGRMVREGVYSLEKEKQG
jgi:hypothetical protein